MISLESYVENMKSGQDDIYFIGGENKEALLRSPLLERLKRRGYDVLLFTNPMDEYVSLHLTKFDNQYKLTDVSKEGMPILYCGVCRSFRNFCGERETWIVE
jgi:heat shock protein beta